VNDDWFWMYVTVVDYHNSSHLPVHQRERYLGVPMGTFRNMNSKRQAPISAVTNDLMRDHLPAFLGSDSMFVRWRRALQLHYRITKKTSGGSDDGSSHVSNAEEGAIRRSSRKNTDVISYSRDRELDENGIPLEYEVVINQPNLHMREIQFSSSSGRWHFPAVDDISWLCLPTEMNQSASSAMPLTESTASSQPQVQTRENTLIHDFDQQAASVVEETVPEVHREGADAPSAQKTNYTDIHQRDKD
jgi:hypothetical protein